MEGRIREYFERAILPVVPFEGCSVLEVGCGDGARSARIARHCRLLTGIDPDKDRIRIAARRKIDNASFELGCAENLRFGNERFDHVVFTSSLHHVPIVHMAEAIDRALSVVRRDGGHVIFYEPALEGSLYEAEEHFGAYDGDERQAKIAAQRAIKEHEWLEMVTTISDETVYRFRSLRDFIEAASPRKNMADLLPFLEEHRENGHYVLRAPRIITICRPAY